MRLIKKYDVSVPHEEITEALNAGSRTAMHVKVVELLREAFTLGRSAERLEKTEEVTDKEGGIVKIVHKRKGSESNV